MTITISSGNIILGAVLVSVLQWLLAKWIAARLAKSIQHEYDKKLEDYKFSQLQRQKAEIIAQLFARWIKYAGKEETVLDKEGLIDYYEQLNRLSLELSLWLPDKKTLDDIMDCFLRKEGSKDIRTLIGQIRKMILNKESDTFDPLNIVLWPKPK